MCIPEAMLGKYIAFYCQVKANWSWHSEAIAIEKKALARSVTTFQGCKFLLIFSVRVTVSGTVMAVGDGRWDSILCNLQSFSKCRLVFEQDY